MKKRYSRAFSRWRRCWRWCVLSLRKGVPAHTCPPPMKSPCASIRHKEDVGLLVYDYRAEGRDYSGGISNADGSLLPSDSENMVVWNREELESTADALALWIRFRVITEYVTPNFENVYPEDITKLWSPSPGRPALGRPIPSSSPATGQMATKLCSIRDTLAHSQNAWKGIETGYWTSRLPPATMGARNFQRGVLP